jgi:hypothetical protein
MSRFGSPVIVVALKLRLSSWVGLAALVPLIAILLVQTGFRTAFIVEHGGTDCGTCDGSPMAFLLGWGDRASDFDPSDRSLRMADADAQARMTNRK